VARENLISLAKNFLFALKSPSQLREGLPREESNKAKDWWEAYTKSFKLSQMPVMVTGGSTNIN